MISAELKGAIQQLQGQKKTFIPPKEKMTASIENDTQYLMALSNFIHSAQQEITKHRRRNNDFEAAEIQLKIFDAISKFQANQGLVNDKLTHYEKVFLPRYEMELEESRKEFMSTYERVKAITADEKHKDDKLVQYMKQEVESFESSEFRENEEYQCYVYKIFKRLLGKHEDKYPE